MQGWPINPQDHSNTFQSPTPKPVLADTHMHIFLAVFLALHWGVSLCGIHMSQEVVSTQLGAHARGKPFALLFFKPEFKGPDPPSIPPVTGEAMLSLIQLPMGTVRQRAKPATVFSPPFPGVS